MDRTALQAMQLEKLNALLSEARARNPLYAHKLQAAPASLESLEQLATLPATTKEELQPVGAGDRFACNLTYPIGRYVRYHQTSGTRGRPMAVLDTADDWRWWLDCWQYVLDAAGFAPAEDAKAHAVNQRAMLAFSFGPFIGFWSAFDALAARGVMVIPGGGMNTRARLDLIEKAAPTSLFCTPNYALHLAEAAANEGVRLAELPVETIVVAGEPGGSVPAVRERIESAFNARVADHAGASEVGAWGYGYSGDGGAEGTGLHIIESEFLAEFISVDTGRPATEGELSHLLLTTLGRRGSPVIRYRTGDLVRPRWQNAGGGDNSVFLEGGVLGRADDMMVIRGVNIFPSAVEQVLRGFPEVVDFRLTARKRGEMDELVIEVEDNLGDPGRIADELQLRLGLRVDVRLAPKMSLPRTEGKSRRFQDLR
ncbi:MAG: phenylacetate--CoA ligase family protein [Planctomycetota bacterium]